MDRIFLELWFSVGVSALKIHVFIEIFGTIIGIIMNCYITFLRIGSLRREDMWPTIFLGLSIRIIRYCWLRFVLNIHVILIYWCIIREHLRVVASRDDAVVLFPSSAVGEGERGDGKAIILGHVNEQ